VIVILLVVIVLVLLSGIPVIREFGGAILLAVGLLWIISTNGGDAEFWAPYVVGFMLAGALVRWKVSSTSTISSLPPSGPGYLAGRIASRRRCSMNHVDL
jgi:hypothetical protein